MFYRFFDWEKRTVEVGSAEEAIQFALERATKRTSLEPIDAKVQELANIVGRLLGAIEETVGPERAAVIVNSMEAYKERTVPDRVRFEHSR